MGRAVDWQYEKRRERIASIRRALGISQSCVASNSKIPRAKLSLIECGHLNLRPEELERVEVMLGSLASQHLKKIHELGVAS